MGEEVRKVIFRLLIDKDQPEEITAIVHERTPLIDESKGRGFESRRAHTMIPLES